ncbi:hypothetical protein, partial [Vibrio sp. 10N.261.54.E10]|uniref:hypothetical protein n=1 Tax=Vibrio sp. 10N.261.54.E10 TaxID=1884475 RepID=UPI0039A5360F
LVLRSISGCLTLSEKAESGFRIYRETLSRFSCAASAVSAIMHDRLVKQSKVSYSEAFFIIRCAYSSII